MKTDHLNETERNKYHAQLQARATREQRPPILETVFLTIAYIGIGGGLVLFIWSLFDR